MNDPLTTAKHASHTSHLRCTSRFKRQKIFPVYRNGVAYFVNFTNLRSPPLAPSFLGKINVFSKNSFFSSAIWKNTFRRLKPYLPKFCFKHRLLAWPGIQYSKLDSPPLLGIFFWCHCHTTSHFTTPWIGQGGGTTLLLRYMEYSKLDSHPSLGIFLSFGTFYYYHWLNG